MKSTHSVGSMIMVTFLAINLRSYAYSQTIVEKEIRVIDHIYQILDQDMIKITFEEGSSTLTDTSMAAIASFVKTTKDESKVERYIVAAWSDKDFPPKGKLSKDQRKLAAARSEHIKKTLEGAGANNVDTFEMTAQPNWIQRVFSTEAAEIKDKGANVTHHEKMLKGIGKRLRDNGGPRTAVIVARFKNEVLSH